MITEKMTYTRPVQYDEYDLLLRKVIPYIHVIHYGHEWDDIVSPYGDIRKMYEKHHKHVLLMKLDVNGEFHIDDIIAVVLESIYLRHHEKKTEEILLGRVTNSANPEVYTKKVFKHIDMETSNKERFNLIGEQLIRDIYESIIESHKYDQIDRMVVEYMLSSESGRKSIINMCWESIERMVGNIPDLITYVTENFPIAGIRKHMYMYTNETLLVSCNTCSYLIVSSIKNDIESLLNVRH